MKRVSLCPTSLDLVKSRKDGSGLGLWAAGRAGGQAVVWRSDQTLIQSLKCDTKSLHCHFDHAWIEGKRELLEVQRVA